MRQISLDGLKKTLKMDTAKTFEAILTDVELIETPRFTTMVEHDDHVIIWYTMVIHTHGHDMAVMKDSMIMP